MKLAALFACLVFALAAKSGTAQDWPKSIRGYKLHDAKLVIDGKPVGRDKVAPTIDFIDPFVADIGITGAVIETGLRVTGIDRAGEVDFLTFQDFRVGDIAIEIDDYNHKFRFEKNKELRLLKPARARVSVTQLPKIARSGALDKNAKLRVTGTVFVFGRFKKFGFRFKRVVPVKVDLMVDNELAVQMPR